MKKLFILLLAVILFTACERKSGRRAKEQRVAVKAVEKSVEAEKVVIIDSAMSGETKDGIFFYHYKIKRLNPSVVGYVREKCKFEVGDTILVMPLQFISAR